MQLSSALVWNVSRSAFKRHKATDENAHFCRDAIVRHTAARRAEASGPRAAAEWPVIASAPGPGMTGAVGHPPLLQRGRGARPLHRHAVGGYVVGGFRADLAALHGRSEAGCSLFAWSAPTVVSVNTLPGGSSGRGAALEIATSALGFVSGANVALSIAKIVGDVDKAGIQRFARSSEKALRVQGVAIALLRPAADLGDLAASNSLADALIGLKDTPTLRYRISRDPVAFDRLVGIL